MTSGCAGWHRSRGAASSRPGETVVRQWEVDRDFYLLLEGDADVFSQGRLLTTMQAGDFFGELAAMDWGATFGYPRLATVRARTDLVLLVLSDAELAELMASAPPWTAGSGPRPPYGPAGCETLGSLQVFRSLGRQTQRAAHGRGLHRVRGVRVRHLDRDARLRLRPGRADDRCRRRGGPAAAGGRGGAARGPAGRRRSPAVVLVGGYAVQALGMGATAVLLLTDAPPIAVYAPRSSAPPRSRPPGRRSPRWFRP